MTAPQHSEQPCVEPRLLHDLHAYARSRVGAGEGLDLLRHFAADVPELIEAYAIGYLPPNYRDALSTKQQRALGDRDIADALIIPATDATGAIVDLAVVHASGTAGMFATHRGMLGARVAEAAQQVVIVDDLRAAALLMRQGYRDVLLVRGLDDVAANAQSIVDAGVRQATIRMRDDGEEVADLLRAVGLFVAIEADEVTGDDAVNLPSASIPPVAGSDPDPAVRLITFDVDQDVATFQVGPVRYAIELSDPERTVRQVVARRGNAAHRDRFDLTSEAQCRRYAAGAARRVDLGADVLLGHITESWRQVVAQETALEDAPVVVLDDEEAGDAITQLRAPNLIASIAADLTTLGWAGEDRAKVLLYLTAISRLLPEPAWTLYRAAAGAAPWRSLGLIAALTPPEDCLVFHRLTEATLRQQGRRALRHKLVMIDRAETLRPEGALALRVLHERGSVGWQALAAVGEDDGEGGRPAVSSIVGDAQGPVAVLAAAVGDLDRRCRDCFITLAVDESPAQTARIVAAQCDRHRRQDPEAAKAIVARHHGLQRALHRLPVIIPFADRIAFPAASVRHREEHAAFLTLIEASALLHQYQREQDKDGAVLAAEADFHLVRDLVAGVLGEIGDGLSRNGRTLLRALADTKAAEVTMPDLPAILPDWTQYAYRSALGELIDLGYLSAEGGGRGRVRTYHCTGRITAGGGIQLLDHAVSPVLTPVGEFATVRDGGSRTVTPWVEAG